MKPFILIFLLLVCRSLTAEDVPSAASSQTNAVKFSFPKFESEKDFTPLQLACAKGKVKDVEKILSEQKAISEDERFKELVLPPMIIAANAGHRPVIEFLLKNGFKIDDRGLNGCTSLMYASQQGKLDMVKFLVEHGADVNHFALRYESTPLREATRFGHLEVVKYLKDHGA